MSDFDLQCQLLAPFTLTSVEVPLHGGVQLAQQGMVCSQLCKGPADCLVEIDAQDVAGRLIRHAHSQVRFQVLFSLGFY